MGGKLIRLKPFESLRVGESATFSKTITEADIKLFAELSGDAYPLHLDEAYAKTTRFGRRVAHGMLSASLLSTVNALLLGLPGGLYVEQSLRFRRPAFIGDTLTARAEITEIMPAARRFRTKTTVRNQDGKLVVDGEALLQKDPS
jgi:3-hydroxybutyryl-CoA dehydratase